MEEKRSIDNEDCFSIFTKEKALEIGCLYRTTIKLVHRIHVNEFSCFTRK